MRNIADLIRYNQEDKDDFYRDALYGELDWFISTTLDRKISKKDYLERLRVLIKEANRIYDELLPKFDEYIKRFNLSIEIPLEDLEYKDFKIVPKNKNDVNIIESIKFANELLFEAKKKIYESKLNPLYLLFEALNDDIDGMFLVASTNWYKRFFVEEDIKNIYHME
ncbi:hypothetical protein [Aliarcobacter butzleri]|uniref:hypothetical protein n=1 Tax=Aliarcobacter butzleri TaxID=28197 RepID=UPI0021B37F8D|nr:hypothetical protein [Aliarcobacter butzleri]MCT7562040.1 hypothetical protein [Aliarcobacter butzleri]